jgi:ParB family chromosome partitioning protein
MTTKKDLRSIYVTLIKRPPQGDRIDISDQEVCELAESIREVGLLQNPLVREVEEFFEIIAGDRRILAINKLGWPEAECVVCKMTDLEAGEARATENLQRVNLTIIEEAKTYERLAVEHGRTNEQIGKRLGISPAMVKRRRDLLKMQQCLQDAMHAKKITYGVAEALAPIVDQTALEYYLGFACDHGVTVTIARQWCSDWKSSMRRLDDAQDPSEAITSPAIAQPTYLACDLCRGAEEVQNLTHMKVCRECAKRLAAAMREEP